MDKENTDVKGITSKKEEDISSWYEQVCLKSEIVDFGKVKGTMVIRPRGYHIWEKIQEHFNKEIVEKIGAENAYFPLFVPESFFKKEADHAEGFTPEVAWLDKELTGDGERLAIRPTSETIIYDSFSSWIRSYKDLPLKINQWCNIVRWETDATKLFLRSREFLWQEGHCAYETEEECDKEVLNIIKEYQRLAKEILALPTITGKKTEKEKFAGAKYTYTIEAFMPDKRALQCGTSHNLGQGFAKGFAIKYVGSDEKEHHPFQSSWGLSTRLIGGTVMTHSDNKGLVLPPRVAKNKAVIIPLLFKGKEKEVIEKAEEIKDELKDLNPLIDKREEYKPGHKFSEWELKGIPLRIEVGPKDIEKNQAVVVKRNDSTKHFINTKELRKKTEELLEEMHEELYKRAEGFLNDNIKEINSWQEFKKETKNKTIIKAPFCDNPTCEEEIKDETGGYSTRCIDINTSKIEEKCIYCDNKAKHLVYFSKSY